MVDISVDADVRVYHYPSLRTVVAVGQIGDQTDPIVIRKEC